MLQQLSHGLWPRRIDERSLVFSIPNSSPESHHGAYLKWSFCCQHLPKEDSKRVDIAFLVVIFFVGNLYIFKKRIRAMLEMFPLHWKIELCTTNCDRSQPRYALASSFSSQFSKRKLKTHLETCNEGCPSFQLNCTNHYLPFCCLSFRLQIQNRWMEWTNESLSMEETGKRDSVRNYVPHWYSIIAIRWAGARNPVWLTRAWHRHAS